MPKSNANRPRLGHPPRAALPFRTVRPSVLDLRFTGDPWVVSRGDGGASLCLDGYQLTNLSALPFDLPSLNRALCHLRRPPARR